MSIQYRVGDVFDRLAEIPDNSIDLIVSSPPFLALRSYLPDDHPDKGKEIGQEPTPAAFIDTHLALSAEYARVLAPHGTLCYEIGDTYASTGGPSGDSVAAGTKVDGMASGRVGMPAPKGRNANGWPLSKSMCIIPHLFTASLAYGRNLLTGETSPSGEWRIRNVICWARPNPPVGALGDKWRPATSYITVACKSAKRYFDLDAVRTEALDQRERSTNGSKVRDSTESLGGTGYATRIPSNPAGAPPLDWHTDQHPEDGDWLWKLTTQPYAGSHFATFPMALPKKLIEAMCPQRVCTTCGVPSTRIVGEAEYINSRTGKPVTTLHYQSGTIIEGHGKSINSDGQGDRAATRTTPTLGWTDCGHDTWRTGIVLDPFGGSGTTAEAAQAVGRHAILIDLDDRNADLAQQRVGMFLEIDR